MPSGKTSKRLRRELMGKQIQNMPHQGNQSMVFRHREVSEIFQGPLPEPETLEKYKNADPSFPERIMRMAEAHNAADVKTKYRISFANVGIPIIGQLFTLILGAGSIVACVFLAQAGHAGGAIAAIVGGFSPIVINAFKGLRQSKRQPS